MSAYAASRLPCTYAALQRVFAEARVRGLALNTPKTEWLTLHTLHTSTQLAVRLPGFSPASLLDFGSGPGTAALAAADTWRGAVRESVSVEQSADMLALSDALREAMRTHDAAAAPPPPRCVPSLTRLRGPEQQRRFSLVVAAYSLGELPTAAARQAAVRRLWAHTRDVLVILEPGTPKASLVVRAAREEVLRVEARAARARAKLLKRQPPEGVAQVDRQNDEGVHVVAPCAHEQRCPMDGTRSWCHFAQRVQRPPAQRLVKGATSARPYQDERFSYVILRRGPRSARPALSQLVAFSADSDFDEEDGYVEDDERDSDADDDDSSGSDASASEDDEDEPSASAEARALAVASAASGWARLVRPPRRRSRHVVLDVCAPDGQLQRRTVAASHQRLLGPGSYALARRARWGDAWPHPPVGHTDDHA